ncbi:MAG: 4Fe-4S binding protein [Spirochaetales bacterium]|nr:4Fe-4S binding protein [Spirochaetales bacterium]
MGHNTARNGYRKLEERLNKFPLGAPPSETLYKILNVMFSEEEAKLVALLPIKPFSAKVAAKAWKKSLEESKKILDELASRALLIDIDIDGSSTYAMPPPMAGFFEFSLMRVGGKLDQKVLSELFHQYLNVEDDFVKELFTMPTPLGRAFIQEETIEDRNLYVLDYERASEVIKTASHIGVGTCYCRHKKEHIGEACDAPMEICMTFNNTASSLIKHGYAKQISEEKCLELLDLAKKHNLVQFGENVQNRVAFICNCCSCCCEALVAARRVGVSHGISSSNFICHVIEDKCIGCGKCVEVCPVEALSLVSKNSIEPKEKFVKLTEENCLGCGVCVGVCKSDALEMNEREVRVFTPVDISHRVVLEAIEKGKLQHLIFDNQAHFNHRVLAAILGVILKLPVTKQIVASEQVKSKYLTRIIERHLKKARPN